MRIIFMGTPDFSVPALKALLESPDHEVIAVYSQPPRPAGRGQHEQPSPVHTTALQYGIEVRTPSSLKGEMEQQAFADLSPDVAIVAAYGLLLPKEILNAPHYGCLNIHASLLPRWRGAAPIHRAILAGDTKTGITIMQMDEGLDTGAMLATAETPITSSTTTEALHDTLSEMGAELVMETLYDILHGNTIPIPQENSLFTYAKKLKKEESKIDWQQPAAAIERQIRAFIPWPGSYFMYQNEAIKIHEASLIEGRTTATPGTTIDDQLTVACGGGTLLRPTRIQRASKKATPTEEVLRGYPIRQGSQLS
ncbi:MAG: methionyl-tRNA formyltransferase [Rickettsiales bacterium]|jgi:methionyl-tRNA formyltransferase|nr:methionyl-tRNA formyltransferase [Rickettsiales bacterium]